MPFAEYSRNSARQARSYTEPPSLWFNIAEICEVHNCSASQVTLSLAQMQCEDRGLKARILGGRGDEGLFAVICILTYQDASGYVLDQCFQIGSGWLEPGVNSTPFGKARCASLHMDQSRIFERLKPDRR